MEREVDSMEAVAIRWAANPLGGGRSSSVGRALGRGFDSRLRPLMKGACNG
jgi:hypothetical protein